MNNKITLDRGDWILLGLYYFVNTCIASYDYYKNENKLIEYLIDIPGETIIELAVIFSFLFWLIPNYIIKKKKYVHFLLFGLFVLFIGGILARSIGILSGGGNPIKEIPPILALIPDSISYMSFQFAFPFSLVLAKKFFDNKIENERMQKNLKDNELRLLRSQIDPHFLFNNLNTIDALIDTDTEKAKRYLKKLSDIYRYLIQTKEEEIMELEAELEFTENYIYLIETRFESLYTFHIDKTNIPTLGFLPTGALQSLVENVVKHNKIVNRTPIKTTIKLEHNSISIRNNRSNNEKSENSLGTGLKNLRERYALLQQEEIFVKDNTDTFAVQIPIIQLSTSS